MKKGFIILLVTILFSLVGCGSTSLTTTDATPSTGTDLQRVYLCPSPIGTYLKSGFGSEYHVYRFEGTDLVVYELFDSLYLLGDDSGDTGNSYGDVVMENGHLLALSNQYLLFATENGRIATSLKDYNFSGSDNIYQLEISFQQLSPEEQDAFVVVSSFETFYQDVPEEEYYEYQFNFPVEEAPI